MKDHYINPVIPLITQKTIYNDIKQAYYGGKTEIYKPYGKNLYYYDINSLYPFMALNDMPGTDCKYNEFYRKDQYNLSKLFGYYYCTIECLNKTNYLGLLPFRCPDKGLIFPLGR
jgi:hypothetical protein